MVFVQRNVQQKNQIAKKNIIYHTIYDYENINPILWSNDFSLKMETFTSNGTRISFFLNISASQQKETWLSLNNYQDYSFTFIDCTLNGGIGFYNSTSNCTISNGTNCFIPSFIPSDYLSFTISKLINSTYFNWTIIDKNIENVIWSAYSNNSPYGVLYLSTIDGVPLRLDLYIIDILMSSYLITYYNNVIPIFPSTPTSCYNM